MTQIQKIRTGNSICYRCWCKNTFHSLQQAKACQHGYGEGILADEISVAWHIDDVKSVAEDLTDDECRLVLQLAQHNHDANIGINWEVLETWADEVRDGRNKQRP